MSIKNKIVILAVLPMVAVSIFFIYMSNAMATKITQNSVASYERDSYNNKELELEALLDISMGIVDYYYQKSLQGSDTKQMQQEALAVLENIIFGQIDEGYYWIHDADMRMVMHPINKSLNGQYMGGFKDGNGVALFVDLTQKAVNEGGGFVEYAWGKPGYDGEYDKLSYVELFKPWGWIIGTGVYIDDIEAGVEKIANEASNIQTQSFTSMLVISLIILIIIVVFALIVVMKAVVTPINNLRDVAKDLYEGEGDLTKRLPINAQDEIGVASEYVNGFIQKIENLIANAKQSSNENASISHELSTTAIQVGTSVENSVAIIDQATNKAYEIKDEINSAIKDAQNSKNEVLEANSNLNEARDEVVSMTSKVKESAMLEAELAGRMSELSSQAEDVKSVLEVISDIADQTNLLALNAAIEAARAGEHGRGFAVVADEVRKLAERTQKSLTEINSTISVIVQSITEASGSMNSNSQEIQQLADIASNVEKKIENTVAIVDKAVQATDKTVGDFEQTGKDIEEIVGQVKEINTISSKNARSVEEIASAADHLNAMTDELNNKLDEFKTR